MKNYIIYKKDEKKLLFEKFENDIINLLKIHNVFFVIGKLEFNEIIRLVNILYEKKIHTLNESGKICITASDKIYFNYCDIIPDDMEDYFFFLNDKDVDSIRSNKIIFLNESKLLQKILFDPILIEFNIIILTNVHKRFSKTDLILSLLKKIILKRTDLFIFIFSDFFIENVLNFFNSYNNLNIFNQTLSTHKEINHDEIIEQNFTNTLKLEEKKKKKENNNIYRDFKYEKTIYNEEKENNVNHEKKDDEKHKNKNNEKSEKANNNKHEKEKDDKYDKCNDDNCIKDSNGKYKNENMKNNKYEKKYKDIVEEKVRKKNELRNSSLECSKRHIYKKKKSNNKKGQYDDSEKNEQERKYFSIKNMKLKDLINKKNCYVNSRSNTLSSEEEKKKKKKNFTYLNEKHYSSYDSHIGKQWILEKDEVNDEEEERKKKKKKVLNCLFEDSVNHSLIFDYKNDYDENELNKVLENEENIICKLNEWKKLTEELEKVNNSIRIFVFHLSNNISYNNRRKDNRTNDIENNKIYYLKKRCSNYLETSIDLIKKLIENKKTNENILIILNNDYEIEIVKNGLQDKNISSNYIEIIKDKYTNDFDINKLNNKVIILKDMTFYRKLKNIKYIIDTCYMKDEIYDYDLNVTHKYTVLSNKNKCEERNFISNNSTCFRLITINDYLNLMNEYPLPQILKKDIFYNIYFLKTIGVKNICSFDFITAPLLKSLKRCFELFYILKLMDINGNIIDKKLSLLICYLPLKFKYSIFLINSIKYKCVYEVSIIVSMLINEPIFSFNHKNANRLKTMRLSLMAEESDILSYYNIFQNFNKAKNKKNFCYDHFLVYNSIKKATDFFNKLKNILNDFGIEMKKSNNIEYIFKAKISSFFYNVSKVVSDNNYKLLNKKSDKLFSLHPLSILNETECDKRKFIVYIDAYSNNQSQIFIKNASIIDPLWLTDVYPSYFFNKHIKNMEEIK
ncbi:conserved protein, unknown function [Plasmodium gallinaceum]|uniref:DEAD-box helicase OB fold domain-containing protein n=1 Tax=Plasmodium gallinaceum TaxID=5849 RepID=A0A1J1GTD9_PLAGA|nr:conserved protein, unknown function [Plasmodium gallinaceum]CRG94566.1 conserved protein, unknown function [Plasmodium gallinaceum]